MSFPHKNQIDFHHLDLEDVMSEIQRPKIDEYDDWIVAEAIMRKHIPASNSKAAVKLFLSDVDGNVINRRPCYFIKIYYYDFCRFLGSRRSNQNRTDRYQ